MVGGKWSVLILAELWTHVKEFERLTHPDCIDFKGPHLYVRIL